MATKSGREAWFMKVQKASLSWSGRFWNAIAFPLTWINRVSCPRDVQDVLRGMIILLISYSTGHQRI